jgi:hypothetical protein
MADGPLGITAGDGLTPLGEVTRLAAGMAGEEVVITDDAGLVSLTSPHGGLIANLGAEARSTITMHPLRIFGLAGPRTAPDGVVELQPNEAALWQAGRA